MWWNGRHRGLKIPWERSRACSSQVTGTTTSEEADCTPLPPGRRKLRLRRRFLLFRNGALTREFRFGYGGRFGFEPEITAKIARMGVRVKEVPISYYPRTNEEGKKIGFKDGLRAIYCIWKYRKG